MKLENLNDDKFKSFKENEIQKSFAIIGGDPKDTKYGSGNYHGTDIIDRDTSIGNSTDGNGNEIDYCRTSRKKGNPYKD